MAVDVVGIALDFIARYGLAAIIVLLVLDGAMLLPVFPGEAVLVMAVAMYATDYPSLAFLVLVTTGAGLGGSLLLYGIMRGGGRRLVERYPRLFMMSRRRREKLERTFTRPVGQSLVLFLRLVPLTRILVNIPAGIARMPVVRFVILSAIGLLLYHAAFLWFAYEVRRPGSALASARQQFQDAYASPAMDFVAANAIGTGIVVLLLGSIVSVRVSRAMLRDPEEATGSLVGWLTTMVLLLGGLALAVAAYVDPAPVVDLAELRGVDVAALAAWAGLTVPQFLWAVAGVMVGVGAILRGLTTQAAARRRRYRREKKEAFGRMMGKPAPQPWTRGPDDPPDRPAKTPEAKPGPRSALPWPESGKRPR